MLKSVVDINEKRSPRRQADEYISTSTDDFPSKFSLLKMTQRHVCDVSLCTILNCFLIYLCYIRHTYVSGKVSCFNSPNLQPFFDCNIPKFM